MPIAASCWSKASCCGVLRRPRKQSLRQAGGHSDHTRYFRFFRTFLALLISMVDELTDLDETPDRPPTPLEVAQRALILSAVICRASIEKDRDEEYKQKTIEDIHEWIEELRLWPHLDPVEKQILQIPLGALSRRLQIQGTWFSEGLAILSWSLHRSEFPTHDVTVDPIAVTNALDFLDPDAEKLLESTLLREAVELEAAREWFYDLHCTLRVYLFHNRDGLLAEWIDHYLTILAVDPKTIHKRRSLRFEGRLLREAERKRLQEWEWVITERHRASIWLVGEYPLLTEVPVDT
jgi:hypothetical protein